MAVAKNALAGSIGDAWHATEGADENVIIRRVMCNVHLFTKVYKSLHEN